MTTPREDAIAALDWWANVTSRKHNPTVLRAACVDAPSGHWVDLASPETAEALARAMDELDPSVTGDEYDEDREEHREYAALLLAAMREPAP